MCFFITVGFLRLNRTEIIGGGLRAYVFHAYTYPKNILKKPSETFKNVLIF